MRVNKLSRPLIACLCCWVGVLSLFPVAAAAQQHRPGDEPLEVELLPGVSAAPPAIFSLPALPPSRFDPPSDSKGEARFLIRRFEFEGNQSLSNSELARIVEPFTNRRLGSQELAAARDAVTRHYVAAGYVTSGAVLPAQDLGDGTVLMRVVEGTLSDIQIEGNRHFRSRYLRRRLESAADGPLNISGLENELRLLQEDPRLRRLDARLLPDREPGRSRLQVRFEEESPYLLSFGFANDRNPTLGGETGTLTLGHRNLLGIGDELIASVAQARGLGEWDVGYNLPVTRFDTRLELRARHSNSDIIDSDFARSNGADIGAKSTTYSVGVRHPLLRTPTNQIWIGLRGEKRRSTTSLAIQDLSLGDDFCFAEGFDDNCGRVTALRALQEWTLRGANSVFAARSTFSFGLDALDATHWKDAVASERSSRLADGEFFSWLGQAQWLYRLPERYGSTQILVRGDMQRTRDPLLSMERFAVGGSGSVRGYRENRLVRDNGFVGSLELRIPVWRDSLGREVAQLAPFFDVGRAWNVDQNSSDGRIAGAGLGLRLNFRDSLYLNVYWGSKLNDLATPGSRDLQDHGIHFEAGWRAL